MTKVRTVAENKIIDAKLDAAIAKMEPGEVMTCKEIARISGLSRNRIGQIEQKALKKLREGLENGHGRVASRSVEASRRSTNRYHG